jgi:flagellar basal-body rod modification protein FlgD
MSVAAVASSSFSELGLALRSPEKKADALGQQDFLKLMTTQLTNQDPTKPLESNEFLGQLAQFSTVSGIQGLQESFSSLSASLASSQSLQAAGLVGHGVLVPSDTGYLDPDLGMSGAVELDHAGQLVVEFRDATGQVQRRIDYGQQAAGLAYFQWDGHDGAGNALQAGHYTLRATVTSGGATQAAETLAAAAVQSVSIGSSGLALQLGGLGEVPFSSVRQIL